MNQSTVTEILNTLPSNILLVAAAKTRTQAEIEAAIDAGVEILGYNYVQEAEQMFALLGRRAAWHLIGHLQRNKVKKAIDLFDMVETIDSLPLAELVNKECAKLGRVMPILIEVNSGRESRKNGVWPEHVEPLARQLSPLPHLQVQGLMTIGPAVEDLRPYFRVTKALFDQLRQAKIPNIDMRYLSMGMSDSYLIAIEEGANIVRIGTKLFGARPSHKSA